MHSSLYKIQGESSLTPHTMTGRLTPSHTTPTLSGLPRLIQTYAFQCHIRQHFLSGSSPGRGRLEVLTGTLLAIKMKRVMRNPTFWFPTWPDTNQDVQLQKMDRGLKFRIHKAEEFYYPCTENKGADLRL